MPRASSRASVSRDFEHCGLCRITTPDMTVSSRAGGLGSGRARQRGEFARDDGTLRFDTLRETAEQRLRAGGEHLVTLRRDVALVVERLYAFDAIAEPVH